MSEKKQVPLASSPADPAASSPPARAAGETPADQPARRRRYILCLLLVAFSLPLYGQAIVATPHGIAVAHDGQLQLFNENLVWTTGGVAASSKLIAGDDRVAVLDSLNDQVRVVELASGRATSYHSGATPVDGVFQGRTLYLLERDARALERIGADGAGASINIAVDPAFLRAAGDRLYVYSRVAGVLQEVTTSPFVLRRSAPVAPFASDLQLDGKRAYLVYPHEAKIRVVDLATMKPAGEMAVGAVPASLGVASTGSALTARTFAVADPSAKRIWMVEGTQTFSQAFARGFLRGLIGLGLGGARDAQFPTGVDRVVIRGGQWVAYDSSSGTLYRFTRKNSSAVAKDVAPQAFTATPDAVFWWDATVRRLHRISG